MAELRQGMIRGMNLDVTGSAGCVECINPNGTTDFSDLALMYKGFSCPAVGVSYTLAGSTRCIGGRDIQGRRDKKHTGRDAQVTQITLTTNHD